MSLDPDETPSAWSRNLYRLRAGFLKCYREALETHPDAEGRLKLEIELDEHGTPTRVRAIVSGDLPRDVGTCIAGHVCRADFSPPTDGDRTFVVPFILENRY